MKRDKYFEAKKQFFALDAKLTENRQAQRNLGWIKLDNPIFNGYKKTLVLREDIARRKDAHIFQFIIDEFCVNVYSKRKDFVHKDWKGKSHVRHPQIEYLPWWVYDKLPTNIQSYFYKYDSEKFMKGGQYSFKCNIPSFYFKEKRTKEYITKVRIFDGDLKREESELNKLLRQTAYLYTDKNWRGTFNYTAPKWYRKHLHKMNKTKSRKAIHDFIKGVGDGYSESHYNNAAWLYY